MELKVWVDGLPRVVCGVNPDTTCRDVIAVLAAATGRTGRFALLERWREAEHRLAPGAHPLAALLKWGEHASDVRLVLRHWGGVTAARGGRHATSGAFSPQFERRFRFRHGGTTSIKKSLTFSGAHSAARRQVAPPASRDDSSLDSLDGRSSATSSDLSPHDERRRDATGIDDGYASPPTPPRVAARRDDENDVEKLGGPARSFAAAADVVTLNFDLCESTEAELMKVVGLQLQRIQMQQSQMKILDSEIAFGELREEHQSCEHQTEAGELERLEDTERRLEASIALLTGAPGEPTLHSEVLEVRRSLERVEADLAVQRTRSHALLETLSDGGGGGGVPSGGQLAELSGLQRRLNDELRGHQSATAALAEADRELCAAGADADRRRARLAALEASLSESNREAFDACGPVVGEWTRGSGEGSSFSRSGLHVASARKLTLPPYCLQRILGHDTSSPQGLWV